MLDAIPAPRSAPRSFLRDRILLGRTPREYLRENLTAFNLVAAAILAVGLPILGWRFWHCLTQCSNDIRQKYVYREQHKTVYCSDNYEVAGAGYIVPG